METCSVDMRVMHHEMNSMQVHEKQDPKWWWNFIDDFLKEKVEGLDQPYKVNQ